MLIDVDTKIVIFLNHTKLLALKNMRQSNIDLNNFEKIKKEGYSIPLRFVQGEEAGKGKAFET